MHPVSRSIIGQILSPPATPPSQPAPTRPTTGATASFTVHEILHPAHPSGGGVVEPPLPG